MNKTAFIVALRQIIPAYISHLCTTGTTLHDVTKTFSKLDPTGTAIRAVLVSLVRTPSGRPGQFLEMARFFVALDAMSEEKRAEQWRKRFPDEELPARHFLRPPRNVGGRKKRTEDMARFWSEHAHLSYTERAAAWRKRFPDDPRTKELTLLVVQERLREADRRKRRRQARPRPR